MISFRATHVAVAAALSLGLADASEGRDPSELRADAATTVAVAGSGEDHLTTAIVHAQETTLTGKVQKNRLAELFTARSGSSSRFMPPDRAS